MSVYPSRDDVRLCWVEGCNEPSRGVRGAAHGFCKFHTRLWRRTGSPVPRFKLSPHLRRCIVPDCPKQSHAHGFCLAHYDRWRRTGAPVDPTELETAYDTAFDQWLAARGVDLRKVGDAEFDALTHAFKAELQGQSEARDP